MQPATQTQQHDRDQPAHRGRERPGSGRWERSTLALAADAASNTDATARSGSLEIHDITQMPREEHIMNFITGMEMDDLEPAVEALPQFDVSSIRSHETAGTSISRVVKEWSGELAPEFSIVRDDILTPQALKRIDALTADDEAKDETNTRALESLVREPVEPPEVEREFKPSPHSSHATSIINVGKGSEVTNDIYRDLRAELEKPRKGTLSKELLPRFPEEIIEWETHSDLIKTNLSLMTFNESGRCPRAHKQHKHELKAVLKQARFSRYTNESLRKAQERDGQIGLIHRAVKTAQSATTEGNEQAITCPDALDPTHKRYVNTHAKELKVTEEGVLIRKIPATDTEDESNRIVMPQLYTMLLIQNAHDNMGHLGIEKCLHYIQRRYEWPGMKKDVADYIQTCDSCQRAKERGGRGPFYLQTIHSAYPGQIVQMDHLKLPCTKRGHRYVQVMIDHFTKYVEIVPMKECTAVETTRIFYQYWICRWGPPEMVQTDRGVQFTADLTQQFFDMCQLVHVVSTAYHPQSQGLVERNNQNIISMIRVMGSREQNDWHELLPTVRFAYNSAVHSSTHITPNLLMTGTERKIPSDLLFDAYDTQVQGDPDKYVRKMVLRSRRMNELARTNMRTAQRRQKRGYDKKVKGEPFRKGDRVLVFVNACPARGMHKTTPKFVGPYIITDVLGNGVDYELNTGQLVHYDRLKLYHSRPEDFVVTQEERLAIADSQVQSENETIYDNVHDDTIEMRTNMPTVLDSDSDYEEAGATPAQPTQMGLRTRNKVTHYNDFVEEDITVQRWMYLLVRYHFKPADRTTAGNCCINHRISPATKTEIAFMEHNCRSRSTSDGRTFLATR